MSGPATQQVAAELEAIRRLKARYFRLLDGQDWDGLVDVFCARVEIDVSADGAGVQHDPVAFVDGVRAVLTGAVSVHQGSMAELELTSADTASGIWAMEDRIWFPEGSPVRRLHGWGHYHERYAKGPGGWRIAAMRLTRLRREVDQGDG
jgi:hypothetical protein